MIFARFHENMLHFAIVELVFLYWFVLCATDNAVYSEYTPQDSAGKHISIRSHDIDQGAIASSPSSRPASTIKASSFGIVYIWLSKNTTVCAMCEKVLDLVLRHRTISHFNVSLITNIPAPFRRHKVSSLVKIINCDHNFINTSTKIDCIHLSPYDRNIFMDFDATTYYNLGKIISLLDHYDFLAASENHGFHQHYLSLAKVGNNDVETLQLNTGVMFYRMNKSVRELFKIWNTYHRLYCSQYTAGSLWDQCSLWRALKDSSVRVGVISPKYNYRYQSEFSEYEDIQVLHSMGLDRPKYLIPMKNKLLKISRGPLNDVKNDPKYLIMTDIYGEYSNQAISIRKCLNFAEKLNRVLIYPWLFAQHGLNHSIFMPFESYFQKPPNALSLADFILILDASPSLSITAEIRDNCYSPRKLWMSNFNVFNPRFNSSGVVCHPTNSSALMKLSDNVVTVGHCFYSSYSDNTTGYKVIDDFIQQVKELNLPPYWSFHLRRHLFKGEIESRAARNVSEVGRLKSIEEIIPLVPKTVPNLLYLSTNSKNKTEIDIISKHFKIIDFPFHDVDHFEKILFDQLISSEAVYFLGSPGSTFTGEIIRYRNLRGKSNVYTIF